MFVQEKVICGREIGYASHRVMSSIHKTVVNPYVNCINCGAALDGTSEQCSVCNRPPVLDDLKYLNDIERLAHAVIDSAYEAGMELEFAESKQEREPLFAALEELLRKLRHWHYEGDGCLEYLEETKEEP